MSTHDDRRRERQQGEGEPSRGCQQQQSDLSSGGGQVRQSNRSGLSRKPGAGDSSRQDGDDGGDRDGRNQGRNAQDETSPDSSPSGKNDPAPSGDHGSSAGG